jgi:hypothetical protein
MAYHIDNRSITRCWNMPSCAIDPSLHFPTRSAARTSLETQKLSFHRAHTVRTAAQGEDQKDYFRFDFSPVSNRDLSLNKSNRSTLDKLNAMRAQGQLRKDNTVVSVKMHHMVKTLESHSRLLSINALRTPEMDQHSGRMTALWSFTVRNDSGIRISRLQNLHKVSFDAGSYIQSAGKVKKLIRDVVNYNRDHVRIVREGKFETREEGVKREVEAMFSQFKLVLGIMDEAEHGTWHTHAQYNRFKLGSFKDSDNNALRSITEYRHSPLGRTLIEEMAQSFARHYGGRTSTEIFLKVSERFDNGAWWELVRDNNGWILNTVDTQGTMHSTEFTSPDEAAQTLYDFVSGAGVELVQARRRGEFVFEVSDAMEDALVSLFGGQRTIAAISSAPQRPGNAPASDVSQEREDSVAEYLKNSAETQRIISNSLLGFRVF